MKNVLAELHELINDLEDHGLTAEASSLQEVFVRVAEEADMGEMAEPAKDGGLSNGVADLLKDHSAAEVLTEIAKQMGGAEEAPATDTETMSFAFGDKPGMSTPKLDYQKRKEIVDNYTSAAVRKDGTTMVDLFNQMNDELADNGFDKVFFGTFQGGVQQMANPEYHSKMNDELGKPFKTDGGISRTE
jgi:hypothetical protein